MVNRYQNKITSIGTIVTAVVFFFSLVSCAQIYSTSKQEESPIVRVEEGIYRGPRLNNLSGLQTFKIRTILNLEDDAAAVRKEGETAKQLGISMINIPMSEIFRPKATDLLRAVKIIEDKESHPVYVHCLHGRDRTGFVIAAYKMMLDGWPMEKAYQEAVDSGHNTWFYDFILGWKESLRLIASAKAGAQTIP